MEILNVENISLTYHSLQGETKAIDNLSFKVNKGEFIARNRNECKLSFESEKRKRVEGLVF